MPTVDVFSFGAPCPPFSTMGKHLGEHDARCLSHYSLCYVEAKQPRIVIMENVAGILGPKHSLYFKKLLKRIQNIRNQDGEKTYWISYT
eukprot:15466326-Alexandrium_andersonii.AAC.1